MTFRAKARQGWNRARGTTAALVAALVLTTGCVRRTTVNREFGLPNPSSAQRGIPTHGKPGQEAASGSPLPARKGAPQPDEALREIFQQQARGAFNPLTDDRRVRLLETRLRLDPQDLAARLELAGIYERYRLDEEALEQYTQAVNLASQMPGPALRRLGLGGPATDASGPLVETAAVGLGRCARAAGRSSQAVPLLEALVKQSPSAEVWNELGMLYDEGGNREAAEGAFRQATARQPGSGRLHNNLGYNLLLQNKPEAAESELRRALELNPNSATARNNLGVLRARRGDREGARQQFRLAAGDAATAHNNLAVVLLELGDYERSREELVQALSARHYFAPAIENFKLVQERLRQRAELVTAGGSLPLSTARIPASLALGHVDPAGEPESRLPGRTGILACRGIPACRDTHPGQGGAAESLIPEE